MSSINSIYTSPLTNGQLWIGNTGNEPTSANLTPGTNINITNSPGGISIATTGFGSIVWQTITTGANPIVPFRGYICTTPGPQVFTYNATAQVGDIYILTTASPGVVFGLTSSVANIYFGGTTYTALSNTSLTASICLVGVGFGALNVLFSTGTFSGT